MIGEDYGSEAPSDLIFFSDSAASRRTLGCSSSSAFRRCGASSDSTPLLLDRQSL